MASDGATCTARRVRWIYVCRNSNVGHQTIECQRASLYAPGKVEVIRVTVKGSCAEGSRMIKAQLARFLTSKRRPASGKPIRKGGGAKPPTFPDGFPGGIRPFRRQKYAKLCFYHSAPFGAAPFYGYPHYFDGPMVPQTWHCAVPQTQTLKRLIIY